MKIVLSTSPHVKHVQVLQSDFAVTPEAMYFFVPLGLLSLVAHLDALRPRLDEVELFDLNRVIATGAIPLNEQFHQALAARIASEAPELVGFMTECDSYHHVLAICDALKALRPSCYIVLGGPHASAVAEETLRLAPAVDSIVVGEGEETFSALVAELAADRSPTGIPGLVSRDEAGQIVSGPQRVLVEPLDRLPAPAYSRYKPDPDEEIFLEVGRGCPFACSFCSTAPFWRRRHRVKSPQRILSEIQSILALYGPRRLHFTHDLFTANRNWVLAVCEALQGAGAPVRWTCSARTDTVDPALLTAMASAGCDAIYFGMESGSARIREQIGKAIPDTIAWQSLADCRAAGIKPNVGFIVGLPGDDNVTISETFAAWERALRLGYLPAHIFGYCPFTQSSLFPELGEMTCDGHFLDIGMGQEQDERNRAAVIARPALHASWFKPQLMVGPALKIALRGVDEFSPLVEAVLEPALELASRSGGMFELFLRWQDYIERLNRERGAASWRSGYGTPAQFAEFAALSLERSAAGASCRFSQFARFLTINLSPTVLGLAAGSAGIGDYRSLDTSKQKIDSGLSLSDTVKCRSILHTLHVDFSIEDVLGGQQIEQARAQPTFLVWQALDDGGSRLLAVSEGVFALLNWFDTVERPVGDWLLAQAGPEEMHSLPALLSQVHEAARAGLIEKGM